LPGSTLIVIGSRRGRLKPWLTYLASEAAQSPSLKDQEQRPAGAVSPLLQSGKYTQIAESSYFLPLHTSRLKTHEFS